MPMKRFLTLAAPALFVMALALPSAAAAQVAAGTVPNTFDRPATAAPPPRTASQPTQAPARAAPQAMSPTPVNAASEETLRAIIASLQAGTPDYSLLTDDLAAQLRAQAATILPVMRGFGAIQSFDFVGGRGETDLFVVNFANAETEWIVGMEKGGKVAALLFRPAEGSAPPATVAPAPTSAPSTR